MPDLSLDGFVNEVDSAGNHTEDGRCDLDAGHFQKITEAEVFLVRRCVVVERRGWPLVAFSQASGMSNLPSRDSGVATDALRGLVSTQEATHCAVKVPCRS